MADGYNGARTLRVMEIANDFRILQIEIKDLQTQFTTPDPASQHLPGYQVVRQQNAWSRDLLEYQVDDGLFQQPRYLSSRSEAAQVDLLKYQVDDESLVQPGNVSADEAQKKNLQRAILEMSCRRWRAQEAYLKLAVAMEWVVMRNEVLKGGTPGPQHRTPLLAVDSRLRDKYQTITNYYVFQKLRDADIRQGFWVDEDPSVERILYYIRTQ